MDDLLHSYLKPSRNALLHREKGEEQENSIPAVLYMEQDWERYAVKNSGCETSAFGCGLLACTRVACEIKQQDFFLYTFHGVY